MKINCESLAHYIAWIRDRNHFSFAGYSDAEWYCILGQRIGNTTGLGQVLDARHGEILLDILRRRQNTPRFLFAIPKCLYQMPGFAEHQIDWFLGRHNIRIEGYERDMALDDAARDAELYPFIRELQDCRTCIIGPSPIRCMVEHLKSKHFIEISTPNLHLEPGGIDRCVEAALRWGKSGVYLISAGVSAAVIIDRLHDEIRNATFFDCGSIWDAFAGIGGQREWRAKLYANPDLYREWLKDNLESKRWRNN